MGFARAAGVLAKLLRKASFAAEGRTAADRARDAAAKLGDAGALRDAVAVALNGGAPCHAAPRRAAVVALLDAAQARLGDLPPRIAGDVALWSLAAWKPTTGSDRTDTP